LRTRRPRLHWRASVVFTVDELARLHDSDEHHGTNEKLNGLQTDREAGGGREVVGRPKSGLNHRSYCATTETLAMHVHWWACSFWQGRMASESQMFIMRSDEARPKSCSNVQIIATSENRTNSLSSQVRRRAFTRAVLRSETRTRSRLWIARTMIQPPRHQTRCLETDSRW
jgi:hypothetical protein